MRLDVLHELRAHHFRTREETQVIIAPNVETLRRSRAQLRWPEHPNDAGQVEPPLTDLRDAKESNRVG